MRVVGRNSDQMLAEGDGGLLFAGRGVHEPHLAPDPLHFVYQIKQGLMTPIH